MHCVIKKGLSLFSHVLLCTSITVTKPLLVLSLKTSKTKKASRVLTPNNNWQFRFTMIPNLILLQRSYIESRVYKILWIFIYIKVLSSSLFTLLLCLLQLNCLLKLCTLKCTFPYWHKLLESFLSVILISNLFHFSHSWQVTFDFWITH